MILQLVFSIFPCTPLPSRTCRTPVLSIPLCCLPISSFVRLVFFPLSLCLARWFWPDLMNWRHVHTAAVCVSLRWSLSNIIIIIIIIIIINPLTARVVGAPQLILQPVFFIFPCSPLPYGTCRTPGLSIP